MKRKRTILIILTRWLKGLKPVEIRSQNPKQTRK